MAYAVITLDQLTSWLRRFQELVIKNQAELTSWTQPLVMPIMASTWPGA